MSDLIPENRPQAVKLATSTWISLGAFIVVLIGMVAALTAFTYETKADANTHKGDFRAHESASVEKFKKVTEVKGDVKLLQKAVGNMRDNMIILMERRGLRSRVKPLPDDVAEAFEGMEEEDIE